MNLLTDWRVWTLVAFFLLSLCGGQVYDKLLLLEAGQKQQSARLVEMQDRLDQMALRLSEVARGG